MNLNNNLIIWIHFLDSFLVVYSFHKMWYSIGRIKETKMKEFFKDQKLYIFGVVSLLFFGMYFFMQYAPDTYSVFSTPVKEIVLHFISCGRVVTGAFVYGLRGVLNFSDREIYLVSYGLALVCVVLSMYKLYKLFQQDIKNEVISTLVAILMIINPFSIELFLYVEKGTLMLSVLLCVLAVEQIKKWLEQDGKKDKRALVLAIVYMGVANCSYQGTVGVFVAISLLYIIKYSKNIVEFIKNNMVVAMVYGIPAILNFILVRFVFTNSRASGKIIIAESISKVVVGMKKMFLQTYDLLPKYLFIMVILGLFAFVVYKACKKKTTVKVKLLEMLGAIYLIVGTTCVTIFPQILQDTQSIWFVARSSYPVGAIIAILLIYIVIQFEIKLPVKQILITACCLFLAIQYVYFMKITKDNYIVGYQDKQIAEQIKQQIDIYEAQTGNKVTKLALYHDQYPSYTYPKILATGDMNVKAFSAEWSALAIMRYYIGTDFEQIEKDKQIEEKFIQMNWEVYDKEQIIIKEDTLHLCMY